MATTSKPYAEKLKDPRWQKKRLEILERDQWMCVLCGNDKETLHVHHKHYMKGEPWETNSQYLVTLCADCHETEGEQYKEYSELFLETFKRSPFYADDLRELAHGIHQIRLHHLHNVVASAYSFALANPKMQVLILDKYFEWLKSKSKGPASDFDF